MELRNLAIVDPLGTFFVIKYFLATLKVKIEQILCDKYILNLFSFHEVQGERGG